MESYSLHNNRTPTPKVAASIFQELCYANKDAISAGIILAGYDPKTKGDVFSIPLGGSLHKQDFAIAGSGSSYIYGLTEKTYKPNMTKDEAINFVKQALAQAINWDGSSGGIIRMVVLTDKPIERLVFYPDEYRNV